MARPKKGITFWDRVKANTQITETCHNFIGHKDECGYGRIHKEGKLIRVHRAIWEYHFGVIPNGQNVCHRCDNPVCVNPEHLFLGTQANNVHDMWSKGRGDLPKGEKNAAAKIKEIDIPIIRFRIKNGDACYAIARDYSVTGEAILAIKHGRAWKHVP